MCESVLHTGPLTVKLGKLVGRTKDRRRRDLSMWSSVRCVIFMSVCVRECMCVYSAHFCVGERLDVSIDNSLLRPGRRPTLLNWALNKQGGGRLEGRWSLTVGENGRKMREISLIKQKKRKNGFMELVNAVERERERCGDVWGS